MMAVAFTQGLLTGLLLGAIGVIMSRGIADRALRRFRSWASYRDIASRVENEESPA